MAQRKTPPPAPPAAGLERVGPYALAEQLRRDRLGEVFRAIADDGASVRIRIREALDDPTRLTDALDRLATVGHAAVAQLLDQLVDDEGRVAVVTPADRYTLAERRKLQRLDAEAIAPLGCVLLDGLAALHARGVAHGSVGPHAVGIDEEGAPRWQDAAIAGGDSALPGVDVVECTVLLRDLGRLPAELEAVLDPTASGVPGAVDDAALLARQWRQALTQLDLPVPPDGVRTRIPGLLPPEPTAAAPRRPLPRWLRPVAAALLVAAALGIVPVAALGPGGGALADHIDAYAPLRKGLQLTYRLTAGGVAGDVTLTVADVRTIAGELTATVQSHTTLQGGDSGLPLGLGGSTIRVRSDAVVRTASGGSVRDLLLPMSPGATWSDRRSGLVSGQVIDEHRTVLGPVSLSTRAGQFQRCIALSLQSATRLSNSPGNSGAGLLWYCPGVGLARAHLEASGQPLDVELVSTG
jgi:hypothetical protein